MPPREIAGPVMIGSGMQGWVLLLYDAIVGRDFFGAGTCLFSTFLFTLGLIITVQALRDKP